MKFGNINQSFLSPQGNGPGILWGANKGAKKDVLKIYQDHLEKS
jgi:hypothetical protein